MEITFFSELVDFMPIVVIKVWHFVWLYIYKYIYVCVCVCAQIGENKQALIRKKKKRKINK